MIKRNLIANLVAKFWNLLISIALVPYYIRFLGIEAYGLIGLFAAITAISSILDFGLSTTANREMARLSIADIENRRERVDFARTLEVIYWSTGIILGLVCISCSSWIAHHWLHSHQIPPEALQKAVVWMGITLASLWPFAFYSGALMGLEKQLSLNVLVTSFTTLRTLGAVVVLAVISPTIEAFFIWQALIYLLQTVVAALILWKNLPSNPVPKFKPSTLKKVWAFTTGMTGVSLTVIILTNLDKILLSKILSLEFFGYYTFASTLAAGLTHLSGPVNTTIFPRLSKHVALGNEEEIKRLYHLASQLNTSLLVPVALFLFFFSGEILTIWGINTSTINGTLWLIPCLTFGTLLNALLGIPYITQLSYGWTRFPLLQNSIAIVILVPLLLWTSHNYGALGAAWCWVCLNVGYCFISLPFMHKKILKHELRKWYIQDCLLPFLTTAAILLLGRLLLPTSLSGPQTFWVLTLLFLLAAAACCWTAPLMREQVINYLRRQKKVDA